MRQKRELFHKQIRREAIQKIFKQKRLIHFNYSYNKILNLQQTNLVKDECLEYFNRFKQQLNEALQQENQNNIFIAIRQSYTCLKNLLLKAKTSPQCLSFILNNWLGFSFPQLLIQSTEIFQKINKKNFVAIRKESYRFAILQFQLILQYENAIQFSIQDFQKISNFLFLATDQLANDTKAIKYILAIVNSIIYFSVQARHYFFFYNHDKEAQFGKYLSFENICNVLFNIRQRKWHSKGEEQDQKNAIDIKISFILMFCTFSNQLQAMQKYLQKCSKNPETYVRQFQIQQSTQMQCYEKSLSQAKFKENKVLRLSSYLGKTAICLIFQVISEMRVFYLLNWFENEQNQQNLANCLDAFRLFIEFNPKYEIINEFTDYQLIQLLNLLISRELNVVVKNFTIYLIDSIVFLDDRNKITDGLVQYHNLFQKIWSYQEPSIFKVKINIVNNLLLSDLGYKAVMKYLSELAITLYETKFVRQALNFCKNALLHTNFQVSSCTQFKFIIDILYSLPQKYYTVEDMENELYIFTHLYENGFARALPKRYEDWQTQFNRIELKNRYDIKENPEIESKLKCFELITSLYSHYERQFDRIDSMEE